MTISYAIGVSIRNLRRYPMRSALSVLGMVIGIFAVSLTVSLGNAVQDFVLGQLTSFGTNIVRIHAKVPGLSEFGTASARVQGIVVTTLKPADFQAMETFPFVDATASFSSTQTWAVRGNEEKQILVLASTWQYQAIDEQAILAEGRFFTDSEDRSAERVVVLGSGVRDKFFIGTDPIGQLFRVGKTTFRVVGSMKPRGATFGFNFDDMVYVPLRTAQQTLISGDHVDEGGIKLKLGTNEDAAGVALTDFLRRRHRISDPDKDDFVVTTTEQAIGIATTVTNVMRFLLITLAAISLVVGGVGIMNIMLASVTERLHEIGVRKAYGASSASVFRQFLVESMTLASLGGLVGTALATLGIMAAGAAVKAQGYEWKLGFPLGAIAISLTVSALIGVIFGIYPARKASRMGAIEALRVD